MLTIIIIIIYYSWVVTQWQWLFYMYTKHEIGWYWLLLYFVDPFNKNKSRATKYVAYLYQYNNTSAIQENAFLGSVRYTAKTRSDLCKEFFFSRNFFKYICAFNLISSHYFGYNVGPVAQSVYRLSCGLGGPGIESRWGWNIPTVQTGPGAHTASRKMGTGSFPGVKCGRGVLLTTHPLLGPRPWNSRAIPLPTLWATPGL